MCRKRETLPFEFLEEKEPVNHLVEVGCAEFYHSVHEIFPFVLLAERSYIGSRPRTELREEDRIAVDSCCDGIQFRACCKGHRADKEKKERRFHFAVIL